MDREEIFRRRAEFIDKEREKECRWLWLSFAGEEGWRGGCYMLAPGFATAVARSWDLGINPGGEVLGFNLPPDFVPPKELQNRLLSKADLEASCGGAVRM